MADIGLGITNATGDQLMDDNSSSNEIVDGVHRYPRTGLRVVIVGAGVGGLMAALECWRKGHEVQLLERTEELSVLGDGFTITPSGLATLHQYPSMQQEYDEHAYDSVISWYSYSGTKYHSEDPEWRGRDDHPAGKQRVSFVMARPQFARLMLDQAARLGIPIHWGCKVTRYEEDVDLAQARVFTEAGAVFVGDVVVAADGIGTKSHGVINEGNIKIEPSGFTAARAAFPRDAISPDSEAASLLPAPGSRPDFRCYIAENEHLILMLQHDWIGIAYTHRDRTDTPPNTRHSYMTKETLYQSLLTKQNSNGSLDPALVSLVQQIPPDTKITDWRLNWRKPVDNWSSAAGHVIQLGDSAHSFLPTSGNGATQAIEDAISLPECLRLGCQRQPDRAIHLADKEGGAERERRRWSTKVHQLLRFQRVSLIQKSGFENRERMHHAHTIMDKLYENNAIDPEMRIHKYGDWMWRHNPERYAAENYERAFRHLVYGEEFRNTNIPEGVEDVEWSPEEVAQEAHDMREKGENRV